MKTKHYYKIIVLLWVLLLTFQLSCKKYLDQKPDLTKAVPETLADCQVLLDDYNTMNTSYPDHGEVASDNFYLTDATWAGLGFSNPEEKDNYIWAPQGQHTKQWLNCYKVVYNSNLVLQVLEKFSAGNENYNTLKGSALFFRGFSFYQAAQLFAKDYLASSDETDLGIPLRLSPDLDVKSERSTVKQTYLQIIKDFTEAIDLLPTETSIPSRPSKAAAYAALARTYLTIGDYSNAHKMATKCLELHNTLINYNESTPVPTKTTASPDNYGGSFLRFNAEVIFQAISTPGILNEFQAIIDQDLYDSYEPSDKRKIIFFREGMDPWTGMGTGKFIFKGSYDGDTYGSLFIGLATDEIYLIRAEAYARTGNTSAAMMDLNTLLRKRYDGTFVDRTATSAFNALEQILDERRKELIFRSLRWTDLKRLNKDPRFAVTLRRTKNTISYSPLLPNDLRYIMLIPQQVINTTGMQQNLR